MNSEIRILGICGSLRKASFNLMALKAAGELMPAGMQLEIASIADLPLYSQDLQDQGFPPAVMKLRDQAAGADGLLVASPEHNFSTPAALKNAIDWLSRTKDQPFLHKPVAILSASPGPLGGARNQYDLRKILVQLNALVLTRPEVFIGSCAQKFDAGGRLADEATRKVVADQMKAYRDWVERMKRAFAPA